MLLDLRFSNFYSFAEETEISFVMGKKPVATAYDVELPDARRLNKVAAVVGANGSGKTNLIKPLAFLSWFISRSFLDGDPQSPIPFKPHALRPLEETTLEAIFLLDEREYRYRVAFRQGRLVAEALHERTSRFFSYVFVREAHSDGYSFKQQGFGFAAAQARAIRANASILSAAHNYDVSNARPFVDYFASIAYNFTVAGREHYHDARLMESAAFLVGHRPILDRMGRVLCELDLGLDDIRIDEVQTTDKLGNKGQAFLPIGIHRAGEHAFELPFLEESSGTRSAFVLLRRILPVLEQGGLAVIDEIDNDLHPYMLPHILDLFKLAETNPHRAQLVFTCHTPEVLNLLRKHQIYLAEKVDQCSEAWRLDDVVGLRADDNLYAKYMAGALGAVPDI